MHRPGRTNTIRGGFIDGAVTYLLKVVTTTSGTVNIKSSNFTIWTTKGSLSGTATATLTITPNGTDQITNGKAKLTKAPDRWRATS